MISRNGGNNMVTFVGAEYIIANVLIALKRKKNRTTISLSELNELGIYICKKCLSKRI